MLYSPRLQQELEQIEAFLPTVMPPEGTLQDTVARAMRYGCEAGGKRIRPVLAMEFCRLCCGDAERALPFACAVEIIHSYSLIHDDLPCMDNSALRRGKPSTHAVFGEDMALLAGDGLLTWAFEIMTRPGIAPGVSAEATVQAVQVLAQRAGISGMVGGQTIDLESENTSISLERLIELERRKTSDLIIAACELGCLAGGGTAAQRQAAVQYGDNLGLCFQIVDDILDVTATAAVLGKPVGSDAENTKNTFVSLLGLEESRKKAAFHTRQALNALDLFGSGTEDLRQLTSELLSRKK